MSRPGGERGVASPLHFRQVWAASEAQQIRTADYTIAFASLAPWDLDVFIAQADGSDPQPLVPHPDLDYNATFSPDGQWIVFTSHRDGNAELYRVHPDGSALQRLTAHPAFDDAAAFSPDGKRLAFVSSRSGQADIWVLDLEDGQTWNVTDSPGGDFRPAWSPDGQWLAFSSDRSTWRESDLYVIRPDGTELRHITNASGWEGSPSWSPDGRRIAYYASASGGRQIFTVEVSDPGSPVQVTTGSGAKLSPRWLAQERLCFSWAGREGALGCVSPDQGEDNSSRFATRGEFHSPCWSPDGQRVVFHRHTDRPTPVVRERVSRVPGFRLLRIDGAFPSFAPAGDSLSFTDNFRAVKRMKRDGADRREIYQDSRSPAFAPAWSPRGDTIAFTRGRVFAGGSTDNEIYLIAPDGSNVRNVTQHPANDALPSWSPDGQRLVFRSTRDGNKELYLIGIDGSGVTRLTTSPGTDTFPHWSPRGDRIVFASDRSGDFEIYTIHPDGSDVRQLTHSPGLDMHPVWSPDGAWICFASARGGFKDEHPLTGNPQPYGDLYLMRPDGSEVQALTDDQFEDGTPGWAPLPRMTHEGSSRIARYVVLLTHKRGQPGEQDQPEHWDRGPRPVPGGKKTAPPLPGSWYGNLRSATPSSSHEAAVAFAISVKNRGGLGLEGVRFPGRLSHKGVIVNQFWEGLGSVAREHRRANFLGSWCGHLLAQATCRADASARVHARCLVRSPR